MFAGMIYFKNVSICLSDSIKYTNLVPNTTAEKHVYFILHYS